MGSSATSGIWTISPPLAHDAHLAWSGKALVEISTPVPQFEPRRSVYDIDETGKAMHITRQGHLLPANGNYTLDLCRPTGRSPPGTGSACA